MGKLNRKFDGRTLWALLGVFVAVALFSFLVQFVQKSVDAANLSKFDAGFIISDYQMRNYNSMSESDIQAFLDSKVKCDKGQSYYNYLKKNYPGYSWHFEDGHIICLPEERFGDGEKIGSGDTAAHIIWQAAHDYKINPQVLIVLLQKEQGLITDNYPNTVQYRSATGYGCPDTAPCSSQYYGFKNQVRKAAALFDTVLSGGWTNYPLGYNYIQYNPNSDCGGSWVNVRNLATSALYRYTPYQPNAGALAAGYGSAYCGAYGNRNFYAYFEDWFGGVTEEKVNWSNMETPRYLVAKKDTAYYNVYLSKFSNEKIKKGSIIYYSQKIGTANGKLCLRVHTDEMNDRGARCILYEDLEEVSWSWSKMETPRYLKAGSSSKVIDMATTKVVRSAKEYEYYDKRIGLPDGRMCLHIRNGEKGECVVYTTLEEVEIDITDMQSPRYMIPATSEAKIVDPIKDVTIGTIKKNEKVYYTSKEATPNGELCLLVKNDKTKYGCVKYKDLAEVWVSMERPREMKMNTNSYKVDATSLNISKDVFLSEGMVRMFTRKRFMPDGKWCLQTEYDSTRGTNNCIRYEELDEV